MTTILPLLVGAIGFLTIVVALRLGPPDPARTVTAARLTIVATAIVNQSWLQSTVTLVVGCVATIALSAMFVTTVVRRQSEGIVLNGRHLLVSALPVWLFLVDVVRYPIGDGPGTFARLLPVIVVLALLPILAVPPGPDTVLQPVMFGFGLACAMTAFAPQAWVSCTEFKCGPLGQLFAGPFSSENYFAATAGLAALTAATVATGRTRVLVILLAGVVLYASNSRTTQLGVAIALVLAVLAMRTSIGRRPMVSTVVPFSVLGLGVWLNYSVATDAFSNRGLIWDIGTRALGEDWILGRGLSSWTPEVLARNYMHSQSLLLLYGGGAVAVLLYALVVCAALSQGDARMSVVATTLVGFVLLRGLTELAWNPLAIDGTLFLFFPLIIFATAHERRVGSETQSREVDGRGTPARDPGPSIEVRDRGQGAQGSA
ncbi:MULTISPECIES: O-antigen ligase family protein [unclassified Nocardioides]|uniref:O-antigen ligase family protein n=1 Tax=unclassified Nocardioides TaxID=2615069 RepID=UPI0030143111